MRPGLVGAALLSAVLLVAGCSSGGGSTASSPSPSASSPSASSPSASSAASATVCPEVAALRSSLSELAHISFSSNALTKLKTDLGNVRDNLTALHETAGTEWSAQINALIRGAQQAGQDAEQPGQPVQRDRRRQGGVHRPGRGHRRGQQPAGRGQRALPGSEPQPVRIKEHHDGALSQHQ